MTSYNERKNLFQEALQKKMFMAFNQENVLLETRFKSMNLAQDGFKCLDAIDELKHSFASREETTLSIILEAAIKVLNEPSTDTLNILKLRLEYFERAMADKRSAQCFFAAADMALSTVAVGAGMSGAGFGVAVMLGFVVLSLSPWGALALGVGALFAGVIVASMAINSIRTDIRFCRDSQLKEIRTFVETVEKAYGTNSSISLDRDGDFSEPDSASDLKDNQCISAPPYLSMYSGTNC